MKVLYLSLFCYILFFSTAYTFEGFVLKKNTLFLCPYITFGWSNKQNSDGSFNRNIKITNQYFGLYSEYGLTERLTLGFDVMMARFWDTQNGKIHFHQKDKAFALQNIQPFLRFALIKHKKFMTLLYFSLNTPPFGKGTGQFDTYGKYNKWTNTAGIEFGFFISRDTAISLNFRYSAMYNEKIDTMEAKITFFQRFPKGFMLYATFEKIAYINKGSSMYAFTKEKTFNIDAFNFINNSGLVELDLYFGKQITENISVLLGYSRTYQASFLGNKGMNKNYNLFCLEFCIFI